MACRNVGGVDRALRVVGGVIVLGTGLALAAGGHDHAWIVTIVGALALASGIIGFCPPYVLLGISTARPPHARAPVPAAGDPKTR
jgi:hypothetical protein